MSERSGRHRSRCRERGTMCRGLSCHYFEHFDGLDRSLPGNYLGTPARLGTQAHSRRLAWRTRRWPRPSDSLVAAGPVRPRRCVWRWQALSWARCGTG